MRPFSAADSALAAGDKKVAISHLDAAVAYIKAQTNKSISTTMATQLTTDITRINAAID